MDSSPINRRSHSISSGARQIKFCYRCLHLVTFESDWKRGREIISEIATGLYQDIVPALKAGFAKLEHRYAYKLGSTAPIVYTTVEESGVMLTLRYLTFVRRRRSSTDLISTAILDSFAKEPDVEFAYPSIRILKQ